MDTSVDGQVQRIQAMLYAKASHEPEMQFKRSTAKLAISLRSEPFDRLRTGVGRVGRRPYRDHASGSGHRFCAAGPRLGLDTRLKALLDRRRSVARDSKFCAIAIKLCFFADSI
jgi:hypothetical protein